MTRHPGSYAHRLGPRSRLATNRTRLSKRYAVREALYIGRPVLMSERYASLWED